jgi:hypothetical protein
MKKFILICVFISPFSLLAQFGAKAGLNFSNITNASSINSSSRSGFMAGVFLAPSSGKRLLGFRSELIYSKQGYNYKSATTTGNVNLDYILLPQLTTINISRYFQIQAGMQMAFLISAKLDSVSNSGRITGKKIMDFYNKLDYGFAGGFEVYPVKGLLIGARFNISLQNMYNEPQPGQLPSFYPDASAKNNVLQLFAGWKFNKRSVKNE